MKDLLKNILPSVRNVPGKLYHVSFNGDLPTVLEPRLPDGSELATGEEEFPEPNIDRVSFSESITGAIRAIYPNIVPLVAASKGESLTFHVYKAVNANKCRLYSPEIITQQKFVWDAHYTGEWWSIDPIGVKLWKTVEVHFDTDKPWAMVHPFDDTNIPAKTHSPEYITIVEH